MVSLERVNLVKGKLEKVKVKKSLKLKWELKNLLKF
jgi:hypothetical protein